MANSSTFNRSALALLLRIVAHPQASISGAHIDKVNVGRELVENGLLIPDSNQARSIEIDGEDRELVWDSDSQTNQYFSTTSGWVTVPDEQLKSYTVDFSRLGEQIRRWMDMPSRIAPMELLPAHCWDLGDTWIHRRKVALLFIRRAVQPETLSRLREALIQFPRRKSCLILTDAAPSEFGPELPGTPLLVPLLDLFSPSELQIKRIDPELLAEVAGVGAAVKTDWSPVYCSEDGGHLRIRDRDFHFGGLIHKQIIRLLYDAWESGSPRLRTAAILEEVEAGKSVRTMSHAFSGCKGDWKSVIGYGEGYCWLLVD